MPWGFRRDCRPRNALIQFHDCPTTSRFRLRGRRSRRLPSKVRGRLASAGPINQWGPPGPRTGLIVGRVLDSTGAPVPEAIVQMSLPKYLAELPTTPKARVRP